MSVDGCHVFMIWSFGNCRCLERACYDLVCKVILSAHSKDSCASLYGASPRPSIFFMPSSVRSNFVFRSLPSEILSR